MTGTWEGLSEWELLILITAERVDVIETVLPLSIGRPQLRFCVTLGKFTWSVWILQYWFTWTPLYSRGVRDINVLLCSLQNPFLISQDVPKVSSKMTLIPPSSNIAFIFLIGLKSWTRAVFQLTCFGEPLLPGLVIFLNDSKNDWGQWIHQLLWPDEFLITSDIWPRENWFNPTV